MLTVHSVAELREKVIAAKAAGKKVGLVPTMGNLHEGHITLLREAKKQTEFTVVSIFVNPTQFGPNEDFDNYPRTLPDDQEKLAAAGLDLLFAPSIDEMYPNGPEPASKVIVPELSSILCGRNRPIHFTGVATVVSKLFNMALPDKAFFGEKDFQQLTVIKTFTKELCFPVEVIGVPTVRESNGLAMSSRNGYLSEAEKNQAGKIYQLLNATADALTQPEFIISKETIEDLCDKATIELADAGFEPDYFSICRRSDLMPAGSGDSELVILVAAKLGNARLIDNLQVNI